MVEKKQKSASPARRLAKRPGKGAAAPQAGSKSVRWANREELKEVGWDLRRLRRFVDGELSLAELQGVSEEALTKLAEIGYKLFNQGKLERARRIFEGLLALAPREPYFLLAMGAIAQRQERVEEAERWYSGVLASTPANVVALVNRAEARLALGKLKQAAVDLVAACRADPTAREPGTRRAQALLKELRQSLAQPGRAKTR